LQARLEKWQWLRAVAGPQRRATFFSNWSVTVKTTVTIFSIVSICWPGVSLATLPAGESTAWLTALSESLPAIIKPGPALDTPAFCRVNGLRDQVEVEAQFGADFVATNAWLGAFLPTFEARSALLEHFLQKTSKSALESTRPLTAAEVGTCHQKIEYLKGTSMDQEATARASALQSAYFCKDVTLTHLGACAMLVPNLMELVNPHDDMNLFDVWEIVLSAPVYQKVLTKVTLANLHAIEKNLTPTTRFYDDLFTEFKAELKSDEEAIEATFNVLGVLSSNGNNSWDYIPCTETEDSGLKNTIKLLGLANSVLDRMTAPQGFLYTYPRQVNSLCDYGKVYHFWMAAFLARRGAQQTKDPVGAAAAAFTLNKGYQFMKEDSGRDPRKAFIEDTFSNYVNNMRLDMTQAAAGAWFGALSASGETVKISRQDFERGLDLMFKGAKASPQNPNFDFPRDSTKLIAAYSTWKKTLNPDAAFFYFKTAVKK
jgi:hypothetical protein